MIHNLPGWAFVLGGIVWMLNNQGIIGFHEIDWSSYGPLLTIVAGVGLIIAGGKVRLLKYRVAKRIGEIFEKIDSLYEFSHLLKNDVAEPEYVDMHQIIKLHANASPLYRASKLWQSHFVRHNRLLRQNGISNFKRSVNLGYFQWKIGFRDDQLVSSLRYVNTFAVLKNFLKIRITSPLTDDVGGIQQNRFIYRFFMASLLEVTKTVDHHNLLDTIKEPAAGNPWQVFYGDRLISQDLCNSLIEYSSITKNIAPSAPLVVGELGAGYGRLAYVFLKAHRNVKYVIFDIPSAIFISQWYLSNVFPDKNIFRVKSFRNFEEIREEYEQSDIAFFLPEQMELFPEKHFNLFITISTLGEMKADQIRNYFSQIDRLTRGYFYTKQWIVSVNPNDDIVISQADYPVPPTWKNIYERPVVVQKSFFEALYRTN